MPFKQQLLDLAYEPMLAWDLDGTITYWSKGCEDRYGVAADQAIGRRRESALKSLTLSDDSLARLRLHGSWTGEFAHVGEDGAAIVVGCRLELTGPSKRTVLEVHRDLTDRQRLEHELHNAELRMHALMAMSSNWYWEEDERFRLTSISNDAAHLGGFNASADIGKARWEGSDVTSWDAEWVTHRAQLERHEPFRNFEYRRVNERGETIWLSVSGAPIFDAADRFKGYFGTGRNITERKHAENVLTRSNERLEAEILERRRQLEAMYDAAVNAILTIDPWGAIETINTATTRLLGYSKTELIGQNVSIIMPEPYASEHDGYLKSYLDTGHKTIIGIGREVTARRKNGTTFPIHLSVSEFKVNERRYFTGIITDLTDRKAAELALRETERQLAQSQKMEAVGQLTGGLAHDFNNLLTVITGNLELLDMRVEDAEERDLIRRADEAARMGARLTGRLLTFGRRRTLQPTLLNLNDTIVGMVELLRRTLGETVSVASELAPDLWNTRLDASEIENAILNLAINARDAMPCGGRILIDTANVTLGPEDLVSAPGSAAGAYVRLSVSDNGSGMPPEVVARAFEPFFTTKDAGRGTGLGLSTIYGFVRQSGGHVTIYSEVGKGTTVSIYLSRDASGDAPVSATERSGETTAPIDGETILVVEDNEQVRHVTVKRLDALGYSILVADAGPSAIAMLEQNARIDLVFSDVVMPGGVSGFDILRWTAQHRPGVRVLLTSGFAPEMANNGAAIDPGTKLLRKPYTQADLARAVRSALRG